MNAKKEYQKPSVEKIKIDRDISMVMMTTPPGDPMGGMFITPEKKWLKNLDETVQVFFTCFEIAQTKLNA